MGETAEIGRIAASDGGEGNALPLFRAPLASPRLRPLGLVASASAALDHRRLIVLLPITMIAGLIAALLVPSAPEPSALAFGGCIIAAALSLSWRSLAMLRLVTAIAAFWVGFSLFAIHGALFGTAMLERPAYGVYRVSVDEILSESDGAHRVIVSAITPEGNARALPVRRARVLIKAGPPLAPGDVIEGPFRFTPVPGPVLPGGFDTQFHAYFDGVGAYGNSTKPPVLIAAGSDTAPDHLIDSIRRGIASRIDAELAQPAAGVARAIINGDQSEVSDAARDTMATAGIAHVLSVSGLHLTIVAGGVFAALRLLLSAFDGVARRVSVKQLAALGGMVAALVYYAISGGHVAALRSTIMILLVFGAVIFGRRALTMRNIAIAALFVIIVDPASVFRPSFQLSFAAVTALVGAYESLRRSGEREQGVVGKTLGYFAGISMTSLIAGGATLLFSVYHFQQTSPLGVLGNLAALPLVGLVMMPAALLAVLAMPFGLENFFLVVMGWSIDWMLEIGAVVAQWSEAFSASPLLTPPALVLGLLALAWFAFFTNRWRLLGPVLLLPAVLLFGMDRPPDVLISDNTQAVAIRTATGLELADGKSDSFAVNVWRDTYAEPIGKLATVRCDAAACIGEGRDGMSFAIVESASAFAEECGRASLIIARRDAPRICASAAVIDPADLSAHGVYWLYWKGPDQGFEIRPAIPSLNRPWRIGY